VTSTSNAGVTLKTPSARLMPSVPASGQSAAGDSGPHNFQANACRPLATAVTPPGTISKNAVAECGSFSHREPLANVA
jgi:hypothetical protein